MCLTDVPLNFYVSTRVSRGRRKETFRLGPYYMYLLYGKGYSGFCVCNRLFC